MAAQNYHPMKILFRRPHPVTGRPLLGAILASTKQPRSENSPVTLFVGRSICCWIEGFNYRGLGATASSALELSRWLLIRSVRWPLITMRGKLRRLEGEPGCV